MSGDLNLDSGAHADFAARRYYHSVPAQVGLSLLVITGQLFGVKLTRNLLSVEVGAVGNSIRADTHEIAPELSLGLIENAGVTRPDVPITIPGAPSSVGSQYPLDTTAFSNGSHALVVKAPDRNGHVATFCDAADHD